jgi:Eukaryotic translation initiation factor 3 subunit 8 N-terminus
MSSTNAKALNTMKQRLRKYLPEFDANMAEWRENPVLDDDEEEESDEESDEEEEEGEAGADEDGIKRREKKRVLFRIPFSLWFIVLLIA